MAAVLALPKADLLRNALLTTLGRLVNYQPDEGASNRVVQDLVVLELGHNPKRPPWSKKVIAKKIQTAYHQLKNPKFSVEPLTRTIRYGVWGLTELGAAAAVRMVDLTQNLTAWWLSKQPEDFYNRLYGAVASKLSASRRMSLINDHVHTMIEKWITRDAFRKRILQGKYPTPSEASCWAIRSAYTDIRDWAQDAHCRAARGALTEQNRKHQESYEPTVQEQVRLQQGTQAIMLDREGFIVDFYDETALPPDMGLDCEAIITEVDMILAKRRPRAYAKYSDVLQAGDGS